MSEIMGFAKNLILLLLLAVVALVLCCRCAFAFAWCERVITLIIIIYERWQYKSGETQSAVKAYPVCFWLFFPSVYTILFIRTGTCLSIEIYVQFPI